MPEGGGPARAVFVLVVLASLAVLFAPGSEVPTNVPVSDKVVHATLFAALALSGAWAGLPGRRLAVGLLGYAVLSEVLQAVLPLGRDGDVLDALADGVGICGGLAVAAALRRVRRTGSESGSASGSRSSLP